MLNLDFTQRVVIHAAEQNWVPSPAQGVLRKPLAREEKERGHATSVVQYQAGASFKSHGHPLGEEILVLEGIFSDQSGDYPKGSYLRNPPGSSHAPFSEDGCIIFVKLHQFSTTDTETKAIDINQAQWLENDNGIAVLPLHEHGQEQVSLIRCPGTDRLTLPQYKGGEEWFVVEGQLEDDKGVYPTGTWCRQLTRDGEVNHYQVSDNTLLWLKTGHFPAD